VLFRSVGSLILCAGLVTMFIFRRPSTQGKSPAGSVAAENERVPQLTTIP